MIRNLGRGGNTATFSFDVPRAGDYAVNVGYLSAKDRILSAQVNDGPVKLFDFMASTDAWCNGAKASSSVLPIELSNFRAGRNTITFGMSNEREPLIEWISVVVPESSTSPEDNHQKANPWQANPRSDIFVE